MDNQRFIESREGVPQDGPLSPLLANIMLDLLDKELVRRGHPFARYADDFTILMKSQRTGKRVLHSISQYLQNRLKLVVNTMPIRLSPKTSISCIILQVLSYVCAALWSIGRKRDFLSIILGSNRIGMVNTTKSRVVKTSESKFLGFTFRAGRIQPRNIG